VPKLLTLTQAQRTKIHRLYLAGQGPAEIALSLRSSGLQLSGKQISNLAIREKWTRQKSEISEVRQKSVIEALESVRASMGKTVEEVLTMVVEDMKKDAITLKDGGMNLAVDAAGVSAVQRGKKLFVERVFKLAGLDAKPDESAGRVSALAVIFARPIGMAGASEEENRAMEIAAEEIAEDCANQDLDFDDDASNS
jgi:hypothetical protein